MKQRLIWLGVALVLIIILFLFNGKKGDDVIKIGFIGPLSGDAAAYGDLYKAGVQFAMEDTLNNLSKDGKKFEVIFEDGACSGPNAVSAAQKLINIDKVNAIIGGFCSGETLSFIDLVDKSKIINLTAGSNADIKGKSNYVFQTWPTDSYGGLMLANLVKKYNHQKVAVVSSNTDYAMGISNVFVENYKNVDLFEKVNDGQTDFKDVVAKIKDKGIDAVVIITQTPKDLVILSKQLKDAGMSAQIYNVYHNSSDILNSPYLQGMKMVDAPILKNDSKNLVSRFKEKYGVDPAIPYAIATGYDSFNILVNAFVSEGDNPKNLVSYLDNLANYEGVSGKFGFVDNQINGLELPTKELKNNILIDIE